jgi:hypothetical protein
LTASRERSGRQAFPPVIALRLSVAHNCIGQSSRGWSSPVEDFVDALPFTLIWQRGRRRINITGK